LKNWIWGAVKIAIAAVLVWYVIGQIETQDRLEILSDNPDAVPQHVAGSFTGDWRSDSWVFQPDDGSETRHGGDPRYRPEPGFFTALKGMSFGLLALGIALWGLLLVLSGWRWHRLLTAAGVPGSLGRALRLTFIGNFFNNVMFGATGGDLIRAVLVTRGLQENRWRAALSVLVDRVLGLFVLLVIAALVLTWAGEQGDFDKIPALHKIWLAVLGLIGATVIGVGIYMSARARKIFRIDAILARLPGKATIAKVDGALTVYRAHPRALVQALLVSFPIQACGILSFWCFAHALGAQLAFDDAAVVFPVVQTVSALPLAPAGWGLGETLYGFFFSRYGAGFTLGVATSVLFRLATQVGWGLVGGALWAFGSERQHKEST
jgi:uncharacterized protein (TIRG00374 family)